MNTQEELDWWNGMDMKDTFLCNYWMSLYGTPEERLTHMYKIRRFFNECKKKLCTLVVISLMMVFTSCEKEECATRIIEFDGVTFIEEGTVICENPYWVYDGKEYDNVHDVVAEIFKDYEGESIFFIERYR